MVKAIAITLAMNLPPVVVFTDALSRFIATTTPRLKSMMDPARQKIHAESVAGTARVALDAQTPLLAII